MGGSIDGSFDVGILRFYRAIQQIVPVETDGMRHN
jgi:hypothetical protein